VHPADLRLALPGVPYPGRPFYRHGDLQYLEHGTGPQAAELNRLWRANGTMKGGTVQGQVGVDVCPQPATSTSREV
jgi:hypothetical protein